jgi:hypothetical protein
VQDAEAPNSGIVPSQMMYACLVSCVRPAESLSEPYFSFFPLILLLSVPPSQFYSSVPMLRIFTVML